MLRNFFSKFHLSDYTPKTITCLKQGYSLNTFLQDLFAGVSVGIIALPLALAFAIGSGVDPERGLFTTIVAGFLISLLGGSRVQIGGPAGAFVVVVYSIVLRHGYEGLAIATLLGAILMILMGLFRFGVLLKFVPYPVTVGFTTGMAVVIFTTQIKDFLGLNIVNPSPEFLEKCKEYCVHAGTWNLAALLISCLALGIVIFFRRYFPMIPGAILALIAATALSLTLELPVETIQSKFGMIPSSLPSPSLPHFTFEQVRQLFPDALTIALLGSIESLLSAVVSDGLTGHKHRSNCELVSQGIANLGSVLFGGIPATGVIARTTANIRFGAKTPIAGMIHALTIFFIVLFLAPWVSKIPLAALSAVLVFVAWNMAELPHFWEILKEKKFDAAILIVTFFLTVLIDLAVAVQVGVILAAVLFLKQMTDRTTVKICKVLLQENNSESDQQKNDELLFQELPKDTVVFEINGPFFYSIADQLNEALMQLNPLPKVFILRMHQVPLIDMTGVMAIRRFAITCQKKGIVFRIVGASAEIQKKIAADNIQFN